MPLVTTKELLLKAQEGHYAVGAFNVENMEMVQAVVAAAEELNAPVIMQTTPSTLKYADADYFYANVKTAAQKAKVPVVMHLDHGNSFDLAMKAYRAGYTSIMIDGSHELFDENIRLTKSVVDACHAAGVPVEAELGKVGGKEDDLEGGEGNPYTVPSEAVEFVNATGVDSLAVAIGTAAAIPGTLVNLAAGGGEREAVRFGHPSGTLRVGAQALNEKGQWVVKKAIMSRSARVLMEGWVRVPADSF